MRALVLDPGGRLSVQRRDVPASVDECLIRVTAAGICGTDLELLRGYAQFTGVPGHEFVGIVQRAPGQDAHWIGRRVVGEITVGCGRCDGCRLAGRGHCSVRSVLGILGRDGAFAEYLTLPSRNLHAVPDSLDDLTAVFVEPTAAAYRVAEQVEIDGRTRAAVVGAGRLGLLVAQVLRERGADTVVLVRSDRRRSLCADLGLEAAGVDSLDSLARQFDLVVDATGAPEGFSQARALVRPRGTLVLKSTFHGETPIALSPVVVDEITLVGSRCGPFQTAIEALAGRRIAIKPLLDRTYPLERFAEAFERAHGGRKQIFTPAAQHQPSGELRHEVQIVNDADRDDVGLRRETSALCS